MTERYKYAKDSVFPFEVTFMVLFFPLVVINYSEWIAENLFWITFTLKSFVEQLRKEENKAADKYPTLSLKSPNNSLMCFYIGLDYFTL